MGAILDQRQAGVGTDRHKSVHVADMSAHMAEQQGLRSGRPGPEIVEIEGQVLGRADKDRHRADGSDGARHRGEREGIGQHRITRSDADGAQRAAERIAARGHRQAVARAGEGGEFLLEQGHFGDLAGGGVVAVQPAMPEHPRAASIPASGIGSCWVKLPVKRSISMIPLSRRQIVAAARSGSAEMIQQRLGAEPRHACPSGPKVTSATGTPAAAAVSRSVSVSPTSIERDDLPPARTTASR